MRLVALPDGGWVELWETLHKRRDALEGAFVQGELEKLGDNRIDYCGKRERAPKHVVALELDEDAKKQPWVGIAKLGLHEAGEDLVRCIGHPRGVQ